MSVVLAFTAASLFSIGTYLVLQRKLSRIIIGLALLSHGSNALLMASGNSGTAPLNPNGGRTCRAQGFQHPKVKVWLSGRI